MFDPWQQSKLNSGIAKMKEYRVDSPDIENIDDLKRLAGVNNNKLPSSVTNNSDKAQYERENNIRRGSPEWFKLWFARPDLTGESPFGK
jgi:hypothetical protein